jgi:hypothetical protein
VSNKVVARFRDGRVIKGTSMDVDPSKPTFHVRPAQGAALEVRLDALKALFFVRSLDGDPARSDTTALAPGDVRSRGSTLVALRFADGEIITGLTIRYPPNRPYFFVVPVDPKSNNIRILINRDAVTSMETKATVG